MKQSIKLPRDKKISLVICDCDGTILDDQKQLDQGLKQCIDQLKQRNISFTLASGRNFYLLRPLIYELNIDLPYITDNGGNLYQGEQRIMQNVLLPEELPKIAEWLFDFNLPFLLYTDTAVYSCGSTAILDHFTQRLAGLMDVIPYQKGFAFKNQFCYKITVDAASQSTMNGLVQAFHEAFTGAIMRPSEGMLYTITSPDATKGNALKKLSDLLAVPLQEVMAFGDNHNDISMFEEAGWGIAVSNAETDAATAADDLCGSNGEQGVSQYLKGFLEQMGSFKE